jgi:hypothetical protein
MCNLCLDASCDGVLLHTDESIIAGIATAFDLGHPNAQLVFQPRVSGWLDGSGQSARRLQDPQSVGSPMLPTKTSPIPMHCRETAQVLVLAHLSTKAGPDLPGSPHH